MTTVGDGPSTARLRREQLRQALVGQRDAVHQRLTEAMTEIEAVAERHPLSVVLGTLDVELRDSIDRLLNDLPSVDPADAEQRGDLLRRVAQQREEIRANRDVIARLRQRFVALASRFQRLDKHLSDGRGRLQAFLSHGGGPIPPGLAAAVSELYEWDPLTMPSEGIVANNSDGDGGGSSSSWWWNTVSDEDGRPRYGQEEVDNIVERAVATERDAHQLVITKLQAEAKASRDGEADRTASAVQAALQSVEDERRLAKAVQEEYERRIDELRVMLDAAELTANARVASARDAKDRHVQEMQLKLELSHLDHDSLVDQYTQLRIDAASTDERLRQAQRVLVDRTAECRREQLLSKMRIAELSTQLKAVEPPERIAARAVAPYLAQMEVLKERLAAAAVDVDEARSTSARLQADLVAAASDRDAALLELGSLTGQMRAAQEDIRLLRRSLEQASEALVIAHAESRRYKIDAEHAETEAALLGRRAVVSIRENETSGDTEDGCRVTKATQTNEHGDGLQAFLGGPIPPGLAAAEVHDWDPLAVPSEGIEAQTNKHNDDSVHYSPTAPVHDPRSVNMTGSTACVVDGPRSVNMTGSTAAAVDGPRSVNMTGSTAAVGAAIAPVCNVIHHASDGSCQEVVLDGVHEAQHYNSAERSCPDESSHNNNYYPPLHHVRFKLASFSVATQTITRDRHTMSATAAERRQHTLSELIMQADRERRRAFVGTPPAVTRSLGTQTCVPEDPAAVGARTYRTTSRRDAASNTTHDLLVQPTTSVAAVQVCLGTLRPKPPSRLCGVPVRPTSTTRPTTALVCSIPKPHRLSAAQLSLLPEALLAAADGKRHPL